MNAASSDSGCFPVTQCLIRAIAGQDDLVIGLKSEYVGAMLRNQVVG